MGGSVPAPEEGVKSPSPRSGGENVGRTTAGVLFIGLLAGLLLAGCDDPPTDPGTQRFGQTGEVRVQLRFPHEPDGERQQVLVWEFQGGWRLLETIAYRGLEGDQHLVERAGDPGAYASLISQLNESEGLRLFTEGLDPTLDPVCGPTRTRVSVRIADFAREEEVEWVRCATGALTTLDPVSAGPDAEASRVVRAATLIRDFTVSGSFRSVYQESLPFGTLQKGEDSAAELESPLVFLGDGGAAPPEWSSFWSEHTGDGSAPPAVDWATEMVLVAGVGTRLEAGDSVEVRRVVPTDEGTVAEAFERVPGNFCAPAARTHVPFHIVVSPLGPEPVAFAEIEVERVPCGT